MNQNYELTCCFYKYIHDIGAMYFDQASILFWGKMLRWKFGRAQSLSQHAQCEFQDVKSQSVNATLDWVAIKLHKVTIWDNDTLLIYASMTGD